MKALVRSYDPLYLNPSLVSTEYETYIYIYMYMYMYIHMYPTVYEVLYETNMKPSM